MSELTSMTNIGKEMAKKLESVDITSPEKLVALGAKQAFLKLKEVYPRVCLVHLYSLEGAIRSTPFHNLPEDTKNDLKEFNASLAVQEGKFK